MFGEEQLLDSLSCKRAAVCSGDSRQESESRLPNLRAIRLLFEEQVGRELYERDAHADDHSPAPGMPWTNRTQQHRAKHYEQRGHQQVADSDLQETCRKAKHCGN